MMLIEAEVLNYFIFKINAIPADREKNPSNDINK